MVFKSKKYNQIRKDILSASIIPEWLANSTSYYAVVLKQDGEYYYVNPNFRETFISSSGILSNLNFTHNIALEDFPQYRQAFSLLSINGSGAFQIQLHLKPEKSSRYYLVDWEVSFLKLESRDEPCFLLVGKIVPSVKTKQEFAPVKSITEKPHSETDGSGKDYLEAILNNTSDCIVLIGTDFKILSFNDAMRKTLLAYFKKKIQIGDDYREYVIPENKELFMDAFSNALEGEKTILENETRAESFSIWFEYTVQPVYRKNGDLLGITLTARNIEQRKRVELYLKFSEEKFRKTIDSATNPILIIDENYKIVLANPETYRTFGYKTENLLGENIDFIIPLQMQEEHLKLQTFYKENPGPVKMGNGNYISARKINGEEVLIDVSLNSFKIDNEMFILVIIQNVTERIQSELNLKKYNYELTLLNNVNDQILNANDEKELFQKICDCIVQSGNYKLAWIGFKPDIHSAEGLVEPIAASGAIEYLINTKISVTDPALSNGPTATVLKTGKMVITNDVSISDNFKPWQQNALKYGIAASAVIPIFKHKGETLGVLNIYSSSINAFDDEETMILERLASNLTLAIDRLNSTQEKEKVRYMLNERVKELATIFQISRILQNETESWETICQKITDLIPSGWQYPDCCGARMWFDNTEYRSGNYSTAADFLRADIITQDNKFGFIEVVYTEEKPIEFEGPFLEEERSLLNTLAELIAVHYNKKSAFISLQKSQQNLNSVFNNTTVGHILLDDQFNIITFNDPMFTEYKSLAGIELKSGENFLKLILPLKQNNLENALKETSLTSKPFSYETTYFKDSKEMSFLISLVPILNGNTITGYSMAATDITEFKKLETERKTIIDELLLRNKSLEQFAYIVSHNLRAPMANILGLSGLLQLDIPEEDKIVAIESIDKSVKRMDGVVSDLNSILSVRKKVTDNKSPIDLQNLVENISVLLENLILEEDVQFQCNFSEAPVVTAIPFYMESIFLNLITNSIKYRKPDCFPLIQIQSESKDNQVIITYSDNGLGIDIKKHKDELFGLYKRFHFHKEGKGIGLFMIKTQVEDMGGLIALESELNNGVTITIKLNA